MSFDTRQSVETPTGARLDLHVRRAPRSLCGPRGVVQINHGLAEHAARYARFAAFLAGRGFHTYAHDHRGHGHTTAPDAPRGSFGAEPAAEKVIADVAAVHDLIASEHPGLPVIAFGHSMGALITLNFVLRHSRKVCGVAVWNGNFSAGLLGRLAQAILAWERFRRGSDTPSLVLPRLTFGDWAKKVTDGRTPFDWLSRDPDEVDAYVADPLCGWDPSVGMWKAVFDLVFAGADDRNFSGIARDLPFNLVGGGADPASNFGRAVENLAARLKRMGFSNLVSTVYPQTRHESLNELNRNLIMAEFADWADKAIGHAARP